MRFKYMVSIVISLIFGICFKYHIPTGETEADDINDGGTIVDVDANGKCEDTGTAGSDLVKIRDVTNQSCLYKLWMCSCWASQTVGCLCAKEVDGDSVTFVKPWMGVCPNGSGKLRNPKAQDAGGLALKCAPNPCLACCACGKGLCRGLGDSADDDT
jgi:hypothetical protein